MRLRRRLSIYVLCVSYKNGRDFGAKIAFQKRASSRHSESVSEVKVERIMSIFPITILSSEDNNGTRVWHAEDTLESQLRGYEVLLVDRMHGAGTLIDILRVNFH